MALSNAERQRRYIQRLKAKAAAVTNDLSTRAKARLKRLARHKDCSIAAVIERLAASEENRVCSRLTPNARKRYYGRK